MSDHEITPLWMAEILAQAPEPYERTFIFAPSPPHIGGLMLTLMDVDYDADPIQRVQSKQMMTVTELRESVINPSFIFRSLVEKMAAELSDAHGALPEELEEQSGYRCANCDSGDATAIVNGEGEILRIVCSECGYDEERA